jgi:hypothetical protein
MAHAPLDVMFKLESDIDWPASFRPWQCWHAVERTLTRIFSHVRTALKIHKNVPSCHLVTNFGLFFDLGKVGIAWQSFEMTSMIFGC